jgi:hypothetical protein
MSVINVTKMWSTTSGTFNAENFSLYSAKYSITEAWQVLCEIGDGITVPLTAVGIPSIGEQHPSGVFAYAKIFTPKPIGPTLWVVTVVYEGVPDPSYNSEAYAVDVEWSDVTSTEPIDRDFNGRAIVTANGEKVEGLTMEIADQTCVIRRRFNYINTYAISAYRHSTNSDTFLGWPPGTARLVGFSAKSQFFFGAPQGGWDVTARIQFRAPLAGATAAQAWYKRWTHEGYYVKIGNDVRRATDAQSVDTAKPVLLKSDGTLETNVNTPLFKYTQIYGSLPYSDLGLV